MDNSALEEFFLDYMHQGEQLVPARLRSALALLERLRDIPDLTLAAHLISKYAASCRSEEQYGEQARSRYRLQPLNQPYGRCSSKLLEWGQPLLDLLRSRGFEDRSHADQHRLIDEFQRVFADRLQAALEVDPIAVVIRGRSAPAVIADVLVQAGLKGKAGDVAQYLVGAMLELRLDIELPIAPANNKADRTSRAATHGRFGDFEIGDTVLEVALEMPSEEDIEQIWQVLEESDKEVWLLTDVERVDMWSRELRLADLDGGRVVVASVAAFVGQNISEMGGFGRAGKSDRLADLFRRYNDRWNARVGTPGARIQAK